MTSPLQRLRALGVTLRLDGAALRFKPSTVDPEVVAFMRAHKAAIVAALKVESETTYQPAAEPPSAAAWVASVERETGHRITWDGEHVRILPRLLSGYVEPWVLSEAWSMREELAEHFRAAVVGRAA